MSQSITYPRGRLVTAAVELDILSEFKAPVQLIQNATETDASVFFNGGVAFIVRAGDTLVFDTPMAGTILSDQNLVALA